MDIGPLSTQERGQVQCRCEYDFSLHLPDNLRPLLTISMQDHTHTHPAKHEPLPLQEASPGHKTNFLGLPGELRNRIYELVIYPNHKNLFIAFQTSPHDIFRTFLKSHLYRTSRQVRAETFSYLCSKKSFRIINAVSAETFLRCVGPSGRQSLTSITFVLTQFVDMPARQEDSFFRFIEEAKNLRHFCLEVDAQLTDKAADKPNWLFLARMKKAISILDECTFTWCMIMRFVPDDNEWRLSEMFQRLEELFGAEHRVGGRAFTADGTEIKN
ncbi:hypothetical protein BCR34DRAFT_326269 [Clohesyomyces aquaticus]|uniref:F-box domain-containing protein n=1 Tax=Clohesyomyces aquaticus TaxID=1231657 RepID=A0A1Y1ZMG4_9PLEO|nr:hypothetical protein BCR34DRAFT_326269 [Clohesyomyces aquaticus]